MAHDAGAEPGADHPDAVASLLRARLGRETVLVPVEGSSMAPAIPGGSRVRVAAAERPRRGEVWCYVDDAGMPVVHRVRRARGGVVVLRGDGNRSNDRPVDVRRMVGRVVGIEAGRSFGSTDRAAAVVRQIAARVWRLVRSAGGG